MFQDRFKYVFLEQPGITQDKLAKLSGLDPTYISQIVNGKRTPSLHNLQKLIKTLKILMLRPYYLRLLAYLFDGED